MLQQVNAMKLLLRQFEIHAMLEDEDRAALLALPFAYRPLNPAGYIAREGEMPDSCTVLVSGYAFRQKLTGEGMRQITSLHIPGDVLDLQHLFVDVADHNVQMLTRGEVATIPRHALRSLVRSRPRIAHAAMTAIAIEASVFREWILNVGRRDARARLAHLLCEFAIRMDARGLSDGDGYELPMTQEQLGDALGLTPVHINRMLKSLQEDGLITRNKRNVGIPRWEALRDVGDFSDRYLHLTQQSA